MIITLRLKNANGNNIQLTFLDLHLGSLVRYIEGLAANRDEQEANLFIIHQTSVVQS